MPAIQFTSMIVGGAIGVVGALTVRWAWDLLRRKRLRSDFKAALKRFNEALQKAIQSRDWHSDAVSIGLTHLQDSYRGQVAQSARGVDERNAIHNYQVALLSFSEAKKAVEFSELPIGLRLQLASPTIYEKDRDPFKGRAAETVAREGLNRLRRLGEAAKTGNAYAAHSLLPLAHYVQAYCREAFGGAEGGAYTDEIRDIVEAAGRSFTEEAFRRIKAETDYVRAVVK